MFNTNWEQSDDGYYRVDNGKLLYAPINNLDYTIDLEEEVEVEVVTAEQLEKINQILGTHYMLDEINKL